MLIVAGATGATFTNVTCYMLLVMLHVAGATFTNVTCYLLLVQPLLLLHVTCCWCNLYYCYMLYVAGGVTCCWC